jgi:hypothetical protein
MVVTEMDKTITKIGTVKRPFGCETAWHGDRQQTFGCETAWHGDRQEAYKRNLKIKSKGI